MLARATRAKILRGWTCCSQLDQSLDPADISRANRRP
jgi:hypothetical protein